MKSVARKVFFGTLLAFFALALAAPSGAQVRDARTVPVKAKQTGFGVFHESFASPAPAALRAAFGEPESIARPSGFTCRFSWASLGIYNLELAAFGDATDACTEGVFIAAALTDPSWHTPSGLHPGGPAKPAKEQAVSACRAKFGCRGGGYILGTHKSVCAAAKVPNVVARTGNGVIRSLVVFTHSCE